MNYLSKYEFWLKHATDSSVVESLQAMAGNDGEIKNAFYKDLEFGTAGLRGIMTAGTDRMNVYTVYRATEGLARYMEAHKMTTCSITYDSRLNSQLFAEVSAATLARHGIKVYITEECMPTPYLSYMVRNYHTDTGINVTASHNPQEYNGYKVYDSYGCQLTDDAAMEVTGYINGVDPFGAELPKFSDYVGGLIVYSDKEMEESYINRVLQESLNDAKGLSAVYTPLNGAGYRVVPEVLRRIGLEDMQIVPEQAMPDGRFPTCTYPNPENKEAMESVCNAVKAAKADFGIIFDTDVDRAGAVDKDGSEINRNRLIALISAILLKERKGTIVTDSVTSDGLAKFIAAKGGRHHRFKRGYKNVINEAIRLNEAGEYTPLAIETSGHAALKENYFLDDGAYLITRLLIALAGAARENKSLTDLIADLEMPEEAQEIRLRFVSGCDFKTAGASLLEDFKAYALAHAHASPAPDNHEGCRVCYDKEHGNGWALVRMSLHDPILPINVESNEIGGCKKIAADLYAFLKNYDCLDLSPMEKALQ